MSRSRQLAESRETI
ncbi:hypothetical protein LINGRAHAP2_LOCUS38769 [Linum grandiflorum]